MWVFDGEQWIEEGGSEKQASKAEQTQQMPYDMFLPELQIAEVVPTMPRVNKIPFPLP